MTLVIAEDRFAQLGAAELAALQQALARLKAEVSKLSPSILLGMTASS